MVEKSLKYIENKCPHCALQLILIGKDAHCKGNIRHVTNWSQVISNNFSCLFRPKIAKITKDECTHGAMDFDFSFPWLSKIPLHRIIALWVHPYNHLEPLLKRCTHRATEALRWLSMTRFRCIARVKGRTHREYRRKLSSK